MEMPTSTSAATEQNARIAGGLVLRSKNAPARPPVSTNAMYNVINNAALCSVSPGMPDAFA